MKGFGVLNFYAVLQTVDFSGRVIPKNSYLNFLQDSLYDLCLSYMP